MSLLILAGLGTGALAYASKIHTLRNNAELQQAEEVRKVRERRVLQGHYSPPNEYLGVLTRGRFHSVERMTDVNGAEVFLVDYGNGSQVYQYIDPRIVL